jgi:hypothetical protein
VVVLCCQSAIADEGKERASDAVHTMLMCAVRALNSCGGSQLVSSSR